MNWGHVVMCLSGIMPASAAGMLAAARHTKHCKVHLASLLARCSKFCFGRLSLQGAEDGNLFNQLAAAHHRTKVNTPYYVRLGS